MAKKRVYELAKERGLTTHELVERLRAAGVEVKSNLASVEETDAERVSPVSAKAASKSKKKEEPAPAKAAAPAKAEPKAKLEAPAPAAEPTDHPAAEDTSTSAPAEKETPATPPSAEKAPALKPAVPKPMGPKIVATADEVRAAEQAAAERVAKIAPARRSVKGRGPRLDNIPTVVGPGVPVRKGVKPSSTVQIKGEEPPAPPPQPKPEPKPPARVDRPGGRPAGAPPSGRPAGGPPSGRPAGGPPSGRPAGGPPMSRAGGAAPAPPAPARGAADKAGAARKRPADGGSAAGGRLWKAGETSTRRRVVIDSQAGRRGGKGSSKGGRGGGFTAEVERAPVPKKAAPGTETPVQIQSGAMVKDLADALEIGPGEIIKTMMKLGELVTITQSLPDEAILILAEEFERKVEIKHVEEESLEIVFEDDPADLVDRAPVVTIMGHVDHGKTSLLDAIRETEVVKSEAGGITQHIGAYQVRHGDRTVTFIDTPGHEAFTAMRARGAKVTDVAVIVVAANDGVMPQTIEAIDHAKAAEVPMLVAINKIDLVDSNPDKVKQQLSDLGLQPEEWGGDTVMVEVSAKKRLKLDELMDMILLVTEVQELKANPTAMASGTVVESQLDVGRGPVATILVQRGTLRVGDALVSGESHGKVKAMMDFKGVALEEAGPAVPAQVLGFNSVPVAGDVAVAVKDEREARQMAEGRTARLRQEMMAKGRATTSLDDFYLRLKEGAVQELALIVKGDVGGSVEALEEALANVSHPEVKVKVIHSGVGGINESDVNLAAASRAVIIGFNVRPSVPAKASADEQGVDIRTYRVIYKAIEDVQAALIGMLEPDKVEEALGAVEVRQIFRASRIGTIAGCHVVSGKITRNARIRVVRDGSIVFEGGLQSLKRFNDDVREVLAGFECGVHLDGFDDIKEGDVIEAYEIKEVARTK
ncbi:MAG: translation initiation factor IF-2 [Actinobacteria bacterium]|nr:translation initiation factor IF-2 [Actinomycetota bacterium]